MSRENVEIVRQLYDALNRGDWDAVFVTLIPTRSNERPMRRARPKGGSADLVVRNGHLWTLRDGTILSMKSFPDPNEALEAVGLSE